MATTALPAREVPASTAHGLPLVAALRRDPLALLPRLRAEHGPVVRLRIPLRALYLVADPDAIQEAFARTHHGYDKGFGGADPNSSAGQPLTRVFGRGLLTSQADLHRRQRRLIQPLFGKERIEQYARVFVDRTDQALAQWQDGATRDVHQDMSELTLGIVARTVFDLSLDTELMTLIRTSLGQNQATLRRSQTPWGRLLDRLPVPSTRRWNAAATRMNAMIYQLIADRRAADQRAEADRRAADQRAGADRTEAGTDLLSRLLSARDPDTGEAMSDTLVRDEAMTLLLAGHETTANALAWSLYLLAGRRDVQDRARAELRTVLGGQSPTAADLRRLPYTAAILHESMRLYPPAWVIVRHLTEAREVAGYPLPAGATLLLSPWVVHRDPRWWPEPDEFRPQRWLDPATQRHRYAYFPFGGGPRQCIGNDFAVTEAILVLARVLRDWTLERRPDGPPVTPLPLVTLRPRTGVPLVVRRAVH